MFNYPIITSNGEKILLDCDLSMQNPLACLNTSLLLSYASISPQTRVLVSIIKRWAKMRDINSPQYHTLSSYGYIIMLLHFLTHHATSIDGKVVPYYEGDARRGGQYLTNQPLLPNLQKMQLGVAAIPTRHSVLAKCAKSLGISTVSCLTLLSLHSLSTRTSTEYLTKRRRRTSSKGLPQLKQALIPRLLFYLPSSFATTPMTFDFKKNVVSLNSSFSAGGFIEKEAKAESDGWSLYRQILAIEDPFETFYDVAHVLKGRHVPTS